jgi:hypothetical protein
MFANPLADTARDLGRHHLSAPRRGVHMAVAAGLIALAANVDLKGSQRGAPQSQTLLGEFLIESTHGLIQTKPVLA